MIVRRISAPTDTHSISVRVQWDEGDLYRILGQFARDAHGAGMWAVNESEVRAVIRNTLFAGLRDYQCATLVDWAMATAKRLKLIAPHPSLPGKLLLNEHNK